MVILWSGTQVSHFISLLLFLSTLSIICIISFAILLYKLTFSGGNSLVRHSSFSFNFSLTLVISLCYQSCASLYCFVMIMLYYKWTFSGSVSHSKLLTTYISHTCHFSVLSVKCINTDVVLLCCCAAPFPLCHALYPGEALH